MEIKMSLTKKKKWNFGWNIKWSQITWYFRDTAKLTQK